MDELSTYSDNVEEDFDVSQMSRGRTGASFLVHVECF